MQRRIYDLKAELDKIERHRHRMVEGRNEQFTTVALVGYTNAGKSSLMNALSGAHVAVRDRLFETLDTRTRKWELDDGRRVLLSDTVGFIRKFPHHLVASFHATLEEAREADLLLHVVDASKDDAEQEIASVNEALEEVDFGDKPTIYLLNKMDLVEDYSSVPLIRRLVGELICTSAATGEGLDQVQQRVRELLDRELDLYHVSTGLGNGRLAAFLHENGQVVERSCRDGTLEFRVKLKPKHAGMVGAMGGEARRLEAAR